MVGKLPDEIEPTKPFADLEEEAFLNLLRAADALATDAEEVLKPAGLTLTQYNVLRILRGAGAEGLSCREIAKRMLTHDPDVTRLLDRLERRGLAGRHRASKDRRVITTRITATGQELLRGLDQTVADFHRRRLGCLGEERLHALAELLEQARIGEAPAARGEARAQDEVPRKAVEAGEKSARKSL